MHIASAPCRSHLRYTEVIDPVRFRKTYLALALLIMLPFASVSHEEAAQATFGTASPALYQPPQDASVAYQVNAQHSGNVQGSTLKPPLKQLWSQPMEGHIVPASSRIPFTCV